MSNIFALSGSILKDIKPKPYYNNILMIFAQDNPLKIAVDNEGIVIDKYTKIALDSDDELVSTWLTLMIHDPSNFEPVGTISEDDCKHEIECYFRVALETFGDSQVILNSKQECKSFKVLGANLLEYDKAEIIIYDKDESLQVIKQLAIQNHSGSGDNVYGNKIIKQ